MLFETVPLGAFSLLTALAASLSIVLVFDALKLVKGDLTGESKIRIFQR